MVASGMAAGLVFVLMLGIYGLGFFIIWKFYMILARMNDNLSGIRETLERRPPIEG